MNILFHIGLFCDFELQRIAFSCSSFIFALLKEVYFMSAIYVDNLTFGYPSSSDNIFKNVTFQIDIDLKLGFIGRNGRGKTTFFNLLLGQYKYQGTITSSVQFDYFPYPFNDPTRFTQDILDEICPTAQQWELLRELNLLDVTDDVLWRPFETLSKGEQTKVLLAALFLNPGHFLLIDEPTNHLDAPARAKVAAYLKKKKGFILVSHDRTFLDGCIDHVLSINKTTIDVQSGNFSSWFENFQRQQQFEESQNEHLKKDIARLKQAARRSSNWSDAVEKTKFGTRNSGLKVDRGYIGHKSAKMMKRSKSIVARQQKAIEQKSTLLKNVETAEPLKIHPCEYHSDLLVSLQDAAVIYDQKQVGHPVSFAIHQGDRILLSGKNGSGKTSLLKLILNPSMKHTGTITIGSGLIISYVSQDTSHLHGNLSTFAMEHQIDESLLKTILRKMDFERVQFDQNIENYSQGQKKKVLIAKSLCEHAHLYIWDEPLNYIDIYSRLQIEQLLQQVEPTMLFVEHDASFQEAIAKEIIEL